MSFYNSDVCRSKPLFATACREILYLTLGLWDGAGNRGAGGGDGAHGGAHAVRWVDTRHGCRMGHPGCGVNGPDGLTLKRKQPAVNKPAQLL